VRRVVVVGAGLAGSRCAEALRARGFEGSILLVGAEPDPPYERPALSKDFLLGKREDVQLRPDPYWDERGIELLLGVRVDRIDARARLAAAGPVELPWDAVVLATGAQARRLSELERRPGVHVLRTYADADRLRRALGPGRRLAVVGAGFVGTEVASAAVALGTDVSLVEAGSIPFARTLGTEVGRLLAERYRAHGVDLHLGERIERYRFDSQGAPRALILSSGAEVPCDALLVGIGAEPEGALVAAPGQAIKVDADGRTDLPGVYACGDVAAWFRPSLGTHVRVEHWTSAAAQGAAVARTILGEPAPDPGPPFFWSDQFGLRLQHVGIGRGWTALELEGEPNSFTACFRAPDGRLVAALCANRPGEAASFRRELAAA
jgi:3-phenylpropionate/trans-cinnamate dioxygenase ferredoxin reductase subunit